jgi:O-antigen/teichoic acid export membrane protein
VNVLLNLILIPRWGIAGAAVAHTLSYATAAFLLVVVFVRESGRSMAETVLVTPAEMRRLLVVASGPLTVPPRNRPALFFENLLDDSRQLQAVNSRMRHLHDVLGRI